MTTQQQWDIVTSVGTTALAVAGGRALETRRDDRLIEDPFAEPLFQAAETTKLPSLDSENPDEDLWKESANWLGLRTRFFDDWFENACATGVRQVVILASGLDSRPFRLAWPAGTQIFEIDQPKVLEFKDSVLEDLGATPAGTRHALPVDLRDDWSTALKDAGFDPSLPTAWLAEGLLPYLPAGAEDRLFDIVTEFSAPGSHIAIECHPGMRSTDITTELNETARKWGLDLEELFNFEERPDPAGQLAERGWTTTETSFSTLAERFDREVSEFLRTFAENAYILNATMDG